VAQPSVHTVARIYCLTSRGPTQCWTASSGNTNLQFGLGRSNLRESLAMNPTRPPVALFFIRMAKNGPVAPPIPRFPPNLGLHPSGEPRPSSAPRGALEDTGREKRGDEPALSVREHANPTIWSQIPLSHPSLFCRHRHHPSPIHRTVTFICKNKPKTPISGRLPEKPAGSSALLTPRFRPIRRYLAPDLAVGSANG
jgi:hypothetical protein